MLEDRPPQIGHQALAHPGDVVEARVTRQRQEYDDDKEADENSVAGGQTLVDQHPQALAHGKHCSRRDA